MTTKERIVSTLQGVGYDFVTACQHADEVIKEVKAKPPGRHVYHVKGGGVLVIERKSVN